MSKGLISVIVPVYNAELFLDRCIMSITNQTYRNFELILIDDGSEDNSLEICKKYKRIDNRIKVIAKRNSGVSHTRNLGIKEANGEWIIFIDSDDFVSEIFFEEAMAICTKCNLDIVIGGVNYICGKNRYVETNSKQYYFDGEPEKLQSSMLANRFLTREGVQHKILGYSWGKIYRTSIIKEITFPEKISLREDMIFNLYAFNKASKIKSVPDVWYYYIQHQGSAFHRYNGEYSKEVSKFIMECKEFVDHEPKIMKNDFYICVLYTYMSWLKVFTMHKNAPTNFQQKKQLVKNSFYNLMWKDAFDNVDKTMLDKKYRLLVSFFRKHNSLGIMMLYKLSRIVKVIKERITN